MIYPPTRSPGKGVTQVPPLRGDPIVLPGPPRGGPAEAH